ncbi:MAG: hypothetical protein WBE26_14350, partial [Phycisphaerae bacterium]
SGPGQSNSTEETTVENFEPKRTQTETIEQMPFATKKVTAAIGIPRSFIVSVFRAKYPEATDAPKDDDPEFADVRDKQTARVKASVERIVMAGNPDDVAVDVYPDMEWTADGGMWSRAPGGLALAQQGGDSLDALGLLRTYGPQAGLAILALMSLLMMMRVVRRSTESIAPGRKSRLATEGPPEEEPLLTVGPAPVGQAEVSESLLAGREVDADTLRQQELAVEVSKVVQADPAGTADLLRRWIEES